MSKITQDNNIDLVSGDTERWRYAAIFLDQVKTILNKGITFGDNFSAKFVSVNFTAAATDYAVVHSLGRVPTGYIICSTSASMNVYTGSSAWTTSTIYLRASATGTALVLVF